MPAIRRIHPKFLAAGVICGAMVIGVIIWLWPAAAPLPPSITRTVTFTLYYPDKSWHVAASQAAYANGVVTFTAQKAAVALTVTEQATPAVFNDVPQYYPSLLSKMNEYAAFDSARGTVHLTKPTELNGNQTAVLNSAGTLLFARPSTALTTTDWQHFFDAIQVLR